MSVKKNVFANYLGQGWRAIMSLAFVPLYIKYLGVEAYGLIGIFIMLQAWLSLLDMGMKPALGREMARFTGGGHDAQSIWDLLRSIEIIALCMALLIGLGIWAASEWLATSWVQAEEIPVSVMVEAFALMGIVIALRLIENIYTNCIAGLQRQVLQNVVTSIMATMRGLGAVGVLAWISPTVEAFFVWQGLISLITVTLFAAIVYKTLPLSPRPACFSWSALIGVWRFAAGMMVITFTALLLTQVDKILLTRLLTLEAFGYYALAAAVASALYMFVAPITSAYYPRFVELMTRADKDALCSAYHQSAQLVSVLMGSVAIVLIMFSDTVLELWTADPGLAQHTAPLLSILALGTLLNGLMWVPYQLQLAHGWTGLAVRVNILAVAVLVPAILWIVPQYGAIGAAWVWVALNAGYLMFTIYFMHRRLLPAEKWRWYWRDLAMPLAAAAGVAWICRWAMPGGLSKAGEFSVLLASSCFILIVAAFVAQKVRMQLARYMPRSIKSLFATVV